MLMKYAGFFVVFGISTMVSAVPVTAEWDFTAGINSKDGKYTAKLVGETIQNSTGLVIPLADKGKAQGLSLNEKYPELCSGAIRLTVVFSRRAEKAVEPFEFIWDSKGDYYDKKNGVPRDNSGFTLGLYNRGAIGKEFRPQVWLGFGMKTCTVRGQFTPLVPNEKHVLIFEYDGKEYATFTIDGKLNAKVKVAPGGSLGAPFYTPTIGSRAVGNFFHFNGTIHTLKMEADIETAKEAVP